MRTVLLGDVCDITVGRTPARADSSLWGPGEPWLSIADMAQGSTITRTKEQITAVAAARGQRVPEGTVLLSFKLSIGKVAMAGMPLFTNEAIAALPIRHAEQLDPGFLLRALEASDLTGGSNRAAMGATLNKAKLHAIPIPLPRIREQRRIAAILDQADAVRAKRRQVLAHLDDLTQSIFHDMFAGTTYETVEIRQFAEVRTGSTPSRDNPANYGGHIPWVKTGEVRGVILMTSECVTESGMAAGRLQLFPKGSVVIAMYGQGKTRGMSGILGINATVNQACAVIPPNETFDPVFLRAQLTIAYHRLRGSAEGGNQPNLSLARVGSFKVQLPEIAKQREFSARIGGVNAQRAAVQRAQAADDELFASLQSRAFRGGL